MCLIFLLIVKAKFGQLEYEVVSSGEIVSYGSWLGMRISVD